MQTLDTDLLHLAYESGGPTAGEPVLLLHGWPDDVRGWRGVTPALEAAGYRWFAPWLRGFGPTRFHDGQTMRDGTAVAIAQDAFTLADALGLARFGVVGHDWGGRAAYIMAALQPERLSAIAVLAIGYAPRGRFVVPDFAQCRRWWYQWLMTVDGGAAAIRADPVGFARAQWDSWSPPGWFDDTEFEASAASFRNPDWVDITLHGYRSRWQLEPLDPRYADQRAQVDDTEILRVPTLMLQGASDFCDPPEESEMLERYFSDGYERVVIDGVGHFPARESPNAVATHIVRHLRATTRAQAITPFPAYTATGAGSAARNPSPASPSSRPPRG